MIAPPKAGARDPYMMPHEGYSPDPQPPRPGHPLGTTEQAFDIFYGLVWGARTAFRVGLVIWPGYARLLRGEVLSVRERDFIEAARALGASDLKVIVRHVLPNSIYPVLVVSTLDMGSIVVAAAALSFLGLGAPVGYSDWGQIVSLSRSWILGSAGNALQYWYTVVFPGAALFLFTLGWNLLGDAFRDILDPRLRGST